MSRFCTTCGAEIKEGVGFCTECGSKVTSTKPQTPPTTTQQTTYSSQPKTVVNETNTTVGTFTYFGLMFLYAIPIIGFIICLFNVFTAKNKNLKNFSKAMLIWLIIAIVLSVLLWFVITMVTNALMDYLSQISDGQLQDFNDIFNQLGDLEKLSEQLQNIPLE